VQIGQVSAIESTYVPIGHPQLELKSLLPLQILNLELRFYLTSTKNTKKFQKITKMLKKNIKNYSKIFQNSRIIPLFYS